MSIFSIWPNLNQIFNEITYRWPGLHMNHAKSTHKLPQNVQIVIIIVKWWNVVFDLGSPILMTPYTKFITRVWNWFALLWSQTANNRIKRFNNLTGSFFSSTVSFNANIEFCGSSSFFFSLSLSFICVLLCFFEHNAKSQRILNETN